MILSNKELLKMINITINQMNNDIHYTVIYPHGKGGLIQKLIEIELLLTIQKYYPYLEFYHPEDNTGLPDIYSDLVKDGFGVKVTLGWYSNGKRNSVTWSNGTIQEKYENILFIDAKLNNKKTKILLNNIYFKENFSYKEWTKHKNGIDEFGNIKYQGMTIGSKKVKKLCKKII